MEAISGIVKSLAVIVLLTAFLDMILPSNSMQRFIKLIMGLFVIVTVLSPLISFMNKEANFEEVLAWSNPSNESSLEQIMNDGNNVANVNQGIVMNSYKSKLEKQMEVLIKLVDGVAGVVVEIEFKDDNPQSNKDKQIAAVQVNLTTGEKTTSPINIEPIEPVKIDINSSGSQQKIEGVTNALPANLTVEQEIKELLDSYFDVDSKLVEVYWIES